MRIFFRVPIRTEHLALLHLTTAIDTASDHIHAGALRLTGLAREELPIHSVAFDFEDIDGRIDATTRLADLSLGDRSAIGVGRAASIVVVGLEE